MERMLPAVLVAALACGQPSRPPLAQIHVEVTDGPHAGRYAVRAGAGVCAPGLVGPGSLGVRYTDLDSGAALASLQLVVDSGSAFYLGVVFGGFAAGAPEHVIDTRAAREPRGTGVATLTRRDDTTRLAVSGRTGDGMPLTARVTCADADTTL